MIYLFYTGLASWIVCYVRRKGNAVYKRENLFLLRQFSSKVRTMRFTMGTLTALFSIAIMGCTVALMFTDYQNQLLDEKFPFDVQAFSSDKEEDFSAELQILRREAEVEEAYTYRIYHNGSDQVNVWMMTNLRTFGNDFLGEDGLPDMGKIHAESEFESCYGTYDTYMRLSDYNHLRRMLGYETVFLEEGEYLIHIKERILRETGDFSPALSIEGAEGGLSCAGYRTESFSQDGFAAVIGGIVAVYVGSLFVSATGVRTFGVQYFGVAFLLFFGVYGIYFAATYLGFLRNVEG